MICKKRSRAIFVMMMIMVLALMAMLIASASARSMMLAIGPQGTPTTATTNNTDLTINIPTGVVAGDVLIMNIAKVGNNTTAPTSTGWILIDGRSLTGTTQRYAAVLYKVAGASEPVTYTFGLGTGTTSAVGAMVAFSGVNTGGATPFDVAPGTISVQGNQTAVAATPITTTSASAAVIMFGMAADTGPASTWSGWTTVSPGALTELYDAQGANASVGAAWATKAAAGATGVGAATLSSPERNGGILIALKPKTDPTLSVTNSPVTYNGSAQAASVSGSVAGTVSNVQYNGTATVPTDVGTYAISADFVPTDTASYNSLTGAAAGNFVINKADQTISVTGPAPASAVYNTSFIVTATASSGLAVAYGSAGVCTNVGSTFTMSSGTGICMVQYDQSGDGNYNPAAQVTETVNAQLANTTALLESSANPSVFGASVTFTATVAPSSATGTAQFNVDGVALGTAAPLSGGVASVSTASLSAGTHVITATYSGDSNFNASTSVPLEQTVVAGCASVTGVDFSFSPAAPRVGQPANFTATVTGGTPPITYTWNFGHGADVVTTTTTIAHSFPLTSTLKIYTVMLTTANACSNPAPVSKPITVQPYSIYLPLIRR